MARNTPEKLAQALRANLRRRKAGPVPKDPVEAPSEGPKAPESSPETPRGEKG